MEQGTMQGFTHTDGSYLSVSRLEFDDDDVDLLSSFDGANLQFDDEFNLLECYQSNFNLFELMRELKDETEQVVTNHSVAPTTINVHKILDAAATATVTTVNKSEKNILKKAENKPKTKKTQARKNYRTPATCNICQRTYTDPYNLRIHMMTHTGEKPYECDLCGKRFRQYNKLKIHCVTHTNDKPHVCDICGKGFRYANYLAIHRRLHTGEKPYKCAQCNEHFHSMHARRMHMKLQHIAANVDIQQNTVITDAIDRIINTYTCPICGKVLTDQCYLNAHLKRLHYKERNHECEHCQKRFFSVSELKHHQIAHTRLRKFACEICAARFLRKSNYKQHLKNVHAHD